MLTNENGKMIDINAIEHILYYKNNTVQVFELYLLYYFEFIIIIFGRSFLFGGSFLLFKIEC